MPPLIFSATSGLAAIAASTASVSGPSSDTTARPFAETTSFGAPSPSATRPSTCLAILSLIVFAAISSSTSTTCAGVIPSSATATSRAFARRAISPIHHLRAAAAEAPASTVATISSRTPALTTSRNSSSEKPHSALSRLFRTAGSSGMAARTRSTHPASTCTGTRSGSGKYR